MKEKIVFITGAAGFIGKNTARYFSENGWHVVGLGLGDWTKKEFKNWGVEEWYQGLITKELLLNVKKKPDLIIHCAGGGSVGFSVEHPKEDFDMTVESTRSVLDFMLDYCKNARLIYPSSVAVYGQKGDYPIKESDTLAPVSPYGLHKKIVEELCEYYSEKFDIKVSVVRFFSAYGKGLHKQLLWDACKKMTEAEKKAVFFGTGDETRDWIHIDDVVSLFLFLSNSDRNFEILNGATGVRLTVREALMMLKKELGTDVDIVFNNIFKEGDPKYFQADITKIKALGWTPKISFSKGISDFVNNFKKNI